jgi:4'-phosphopantetheinyl transferase EntD
VAIASSVAKRRREFATVRWCARAAVAGLGVRAQPLVPGAGGAPIWPAGVVGSMVHCDGMRAAAVASSRDVLALGIDAEPDARLPSGVLDVVCLPCERALLPGMTDPGPFGLGLPEHPSPAWDRLLFCAKEAVYKAWFPVTGRPIRFHDVTVTFQRSGTSDGIGASDGIGSLDHIGTFDAEVRSSGGSAMFDAGRPLRGRWVAADGLLATAVIVPVTK